MNPMLVKLFWAKFENAVKYKNQCTYTKQLSKAKEAAFRYFNVKPKQLMTLLRHLANVMSCDLVHPFLQALTFPALTLQNIDLQHLRPPPECGLQAEDMAKIYEVMESSLADTFFHHQSHMH